eukprot:gnl/MRDRNA2_/MRDRNA2_93286_c0_seq1.p1 gnl/MRDRNA2_/MRDRNA2_93286_c0~~gnl/MRDRNA2_/MRDRNA2_93286_c0_seq1.p1  ORF type:complete len:706 (-),score=163.12 gnl/MRDRNA2_/MRDRNA2_93286_c0_seq1:176-2143(-)
MLAARQSNAGTSAKLMGFANKKKKKQGEPVSNQSDFESSADEVVQPKRRSSKDKGSKDKPRFSKPVIYRDETEEEKMIKQQEALLGTATSSMKLGQNKTLWAPSAEELAEIGFRGGFVTIEIAEAKELKALDINILKKGGGASDPYIQVLVDGEKSIYKTKAKTATLEPIWNEKLDFYLSPEETQIVLQLYDHDRIGEDDSMGQVIIDIQDYDKPETWVPQWLDVQPDDDCPDATGKVLVTCSLKQKEYYKHEGGTATLEIVDAEGLIAVDSAFIGKATSDPYVVVKVDGWREIYKSKVKDNTLNPVWNETCTFDLLPGEITLVFEFFDSDIDADDPMGRAFFDVINTDIAKQKLKPYRTEEELAVVPQQACLNASGKLHIVMKYEPYKPPPKPKPEKKALSGIEDIPTNPTPFCLRSLTSEEEHRLWNVTFVGRSERKLRDGVDLRLQSDDVSGIHAAIEVYGDQLREWVVRVTDEGSTSGTEVDGVPVASGGPVVIGTGAALRFGRREIWILERKALKPRSRMPKAQDTLFAENEYSLEIADVETLNTLLRCPEWTDIVEVVLEKLKLLNEAPCADYIEIRDESNTILGTHHVTTPEEMNDYQVTDILRHIDLGGRIMLRLTSDPYLLAPMVERHREKKLELQKRVAERDDIP